MVEYTDEYVRANYHPRQVPVLLEVPVEARSAVLSRAGLLQNLQGGIYSQCIALAARDLQRLGGDLEALERLDRRDNHAAMASCARRGCTACADDAARLGV